jgi:uncharacterized membrane protein
MSHRKVDAARGIEWIRSATQLLLQNPTPFALMGLVLAVIGFVPILGGLALLVIGPALTGGIIYAAMRQERSEAIEVGNLFEAFRQEGKIGRMVMLCLPNIALIFVVAMVLVVALVAFGVAAALGSAMSSGQTPSLQMLLGTMGIGGMLMVVAVLIPAALAVAALLFFAVPRAMLQDTEPFAAMKQSFKACLDNLGAFLIAVIGVGLLRVLLMVLLGSVSTVLAAIVVGVVVEPLLAATMYRGFREVYGEDAESPAQDGDSVTAEL